MIGTVLDSSSFALFLSLLHIAMAAAVTVHALLTRLAPQSTIAWIGLAWLSPYIGPVLYFLFGVNRVRRKAIKLSGPGSDIDAPTSRYALAPEDIEPEGGDEHLEPLAEFGLRLTGRPLLAGNALHPLVCGDEAYPEMCAAIDAAERSVAICSFIFHDDAGGGPIIDSLIAAHRRGVAVRALVDGLGSGYLRSPAFQRLHAADVPAARFMHEIAPWKMSFINLRTHKKVLVIDGRLGFTGGMNIASDNLFRVMEIPAKRAVQDLHFRVEGPVVAHLMETFAEDWAFTTGERLTGALWFGEISAAGDIPARGIASGPDEDNEKLMWTMASAIGRAEKRVRIVHALFRAGRPARFAAGAGGSPRRQGRARAAGPLKPCVYGLGDGCAARAAPARGLRRPPHGAALRSLQADDGRWRLGDVRQRQLGRAQPPPQFRV